jgi:hypothetical protein
MNRARIINSICAMFNQVHNNSSTPEWMMELQNSASDEVLAARMGNWMRNYPEEFAQHGIYIL